MTEIEIKRVGGFTVSKIILSENTENCFIIWTHNAYPYLNVTGCQFFSLQSSYSLVQGRYIKNLGKGITSSTPPPRTLIAPNSH